MFYTLLQNIPNVLFELLEKLPQLAAHYEFSSVEIKELARRIDADAANSRYLLELVERMLIYKFSTYSRQEL
ncbi:DUF2887 domain-containing protein [Anabaena sphaerica]|uniref:DUF2887 domain-containing protein n=1 Tax=Anabaena sphaerica TaxID=212446 RepID=UPI0030D5A450